MKSKVADGVRRGMTQAVAEVIAGLSAAQRFAVERRAAKLIADGPHRLVEPPLAAPR